MDRGISNPGVCNVGNKVGEAFLMSSPGLEGTSRASALICSGASLEEGEAGEKCPSHQLFPVSSTYSRRLGLTHLFWEPCPASPPSCTISSVPSLCILSAPYTSVLRLYLGPRNYFLCISKR